LTHRQFNFRVSFVRPRRNALPALEYANRVATIWTQSRLHGAEMGESVECPS